MEINTARRGRCLLIVFFIFMALLAFRVFYIQIICHEELSLAAESQYEISIEGLDSRGMILDRNYMPLIGDASQYYYFIKRDNYDAKLNTLIREIDGEEIASNSKEYLIYRTESFSDSINHKLKEVYGAYVFQSPSRYRNYQMACHLIGYLNEDEKKGVSGLEYLYQDSLEDDGDKLCLWADGAGNIITGTGPYKNYSPEEKLIFNEYNQGSLVTTIDRRLQWVSEGAIREKSGAVIVMDADNGDILAWASSPTFNPNRIEDYLKSDSDCLVNKVSQASYPPGSVFKIVTALAGLEKGIDPDEVFECNGETEVEGIKVGCMAAPKGGHGTVNMKKAMAVSCNCYFSKLGEKIGYQKIIETATKLGFGDRIMEDFPEEIKGNMPGIDEASRHDTSNLSIGQGDILATPIQVCSMTATIANGGYLVTPRIALSDGVNKEKIISDSDVSILRECMKEVMISGTAKDNWKLDVYGKTGTAEAGSLGEGTNICWFTGYCRQDDRNYVVTVMIDEGTTGTAEGLPVFKNIVDFLDKY